MTRSNNGKICAVIAAMWYVLYAVVDICWYISNFEGFYRGEAILEGICIIMAIVMVAMLLIGNKKVVVGALGAFCLLYIAFFIYYSKVYYNILTDWIDIGVYAVLFVIGILMLYRKSIAKMIWFVPGIAAVVGYGIYWYQDLSSWGPLNLETALASWQYLLMDSIWCISVIFVGLWLMENVGSATAMRVNEYIPNNTRAPYPSSTQGGAFGGAYKQKVYCRNCGAEMQDNENFCFKCGAAKEPNIANNVNANHQNI